MLARFLIVVAALTIALVILFLYSRLTFTNETTVVEIANKCKKYNCHAIIEDGNFFGYILNIGFKKRSKNVHT